MNQPLWTSFSCDEHQVRRLFCETPHEPGIPRLAIADQHAHLLALGRECAPRFVLNAVKHLDLVCVGPHSNFPCFSAYLSQQIEVVRSERDTRPAVHVRKKLTRERAISRGHLMSILKCSIRRLAVRSFDKAYVWTRREQTLNVTGCSMQICLKAERGLAEFARE